MEKKMRRLMVASVVLALSLGLAGTFAAEEESPTGTFGPEQLDTLTAMNDLAATLLGQGDFAGARDLLEQVLEASTRTLGPEHPSTLIAKNNLANNLLRQGDLSRARGLQKQVLEASTRTLGPEHPCTAYARDGLAYTLAELDEAS
jgi:hypothetical protein